MGKAVIVSWVTVEEPGSSKVLYWREQSKEKKVAEGKFTTYKFYNYTSGYIHHTTIRNLEVNIRYMYKTRDNDTKMLRSTLCFLPDCCSYTA